MRITLDLPDDVAEGYRREADERGLPIESVLEGRLLTAGALDPRERCVVVTQPVLGVLEEKLGGGHLRGACDLKDKVVRLAIIKFGDHEIKLTPGQFEELAWRARKLGKTVADLIQITYEQFSKDFFTMVP